MEIFKVVLEHLNQMELRRSCQSNQNHSPLMCVNTDDLQSAAPPLPQCALSGSTFPTRTGGHRPVLALLSEPCSHHHARQVAIQKPTFWAWRKVRFSTLSTTKALTCLNHPLCTRKGQILFLPDDEETTRFRTQFPFTNFF